MHKSKFKMDLEFKNEGSRNIGAQIKLSKVDDVTTAIEFMLTSGDRNKFNEYYAAAENSLKSVI